MSAHTSMQVGTHREMSCHILPKIHELLKYELTKPISQLSLQYFSIYLIYHYSCILGYHYLYIEKAENR